MKRRPRKRELQTLTPRSKHIRTSRLQLAATRALSWPCRCRHKSCEHRRTLPKHPSHYTRPPRCPGCQRRGTMRVDWFRVVKEWHVKPCRCFGYTFHGIGRGRGYCDHNPKITAEDLQERWENGKAR